MAVTTVQNLIAYNNYTNTSIFSVWDSSTGLDVIFGDNVTSVPVKLLEGTEGSQIINKIVFGSGVTTVDSGAFSGNNTIKMVDMSALSAIPSSISLSNMVTGSIIYVKNESVASGLVGTLNAEGQKFENKR